MAHTLRHDVVSATNGPAQYQVRVVANLCGIIARDLAADSDQTRRDLAQLVGHDGDLAALANELAAQLTRPDEQFEQAALEVLLADASRRANVAKPGYGDA